MCTFYVWHVTNSLLLDLQPSQLVQFWLTTAWRILLEAEVGMHPCLVVQLPFMKSIGEPKQQQHNHPLASAVCPPSGAGEGEAAEDH
jgi:hypothetical protein